MIQLTQGGAYLVNGTDIVADTPEAAGQIQAKTGITISREEAAKNTMAYGILREHNTSGNMDNLDYTWYYKSGSAWNVLQEGKDFDFVIADPIGSPNSTYTCAFEAKNKVTDIAYRQIFSIRVSGTFNKGYVLLYEKEDGFDMGMIVQNSQNQYIPKYNILASTAPSLQREGVKPYELNIFADPTAPHPYPTQ